MKKENIVFVVSTLCMLVFIITGFKPLLIVTFIGSTYLIDK